jgi:colanic acid/amylovoran biosynthesis glycosyltransferase
MTLRRIAYVLNVFPKLSETFIAYELAELRRRGVELCVLSLRQPTETLRHEVIHESGLDSLTCYDASQFASVLREFRPQLIHAHFATEPTAAAREWADELKIPFTFTAHGYDIRRKPPPDFAHRAAAARFVVTVSQANARHIVEHFGVPAERLRVIPCGVDIERFRPIDRTREPAHAPLVLCVARHVKVKKLGMLLESCALLQERGVKFRCVSVGDGVCRGELEELRSKLDLERVVEFTGAQEHTQVLAWWQRADIAVLTSDDEGMPVSLMEAAACGVPAVAPAVGGIPELIEHGVTGLLTDPRDPHAFAAALQELIDNAQRTAEMGRAARRRIEERFSVTRQVNSLLTAWSEALR